MRFGRRSTDFGSITNRYCERKLLRQLQRPAISKTSCAISSRWSERNVWRKFTKYKMGGVRNDTPIMIRVIRICRNCGAKIFSDAPEGLCTGCVLEAAIGGAGDSPAVAPRTPKRREGGSAKADDGDSAKKDNANVAHDKKTAPAAELLGELGD